MWKTIRRVSDGSGPVQGIRTYCRTNRVAAMVAPVASLTTSM